MKAALFDMDGTVLDSMGYWRSININYLKKQGLVLTEEMKEQVTQMTGSQAVEFFKKHHGLETSFEEMLQDAFVEICKCYTTGLPPKDGAVAYLERLKERGVLRVIATASPTALAKIALEKSGLAPHFDLVTTTESIGIEKFDPAFWESVCEKVGVQTSEATVFEDALYAMEGAKKAGCDIIGITDDTNAADRQAIHAIASRVINSYDELI